VRCARLDRSLQLLGEYLTEHGIDPCSAEGTRLVAVLLLISGSLGLIELHDRQGMAVDESLDVALWAVRALIDTTRGETS
jgi:hypothetical protein